MSVIKGVYVFNIIIYFVQGDTNKTKKRIFQILKWKNYIIKAQVEHSDEACY